MCCDVAGSNGCDCLVVSPWSDFSVCVVQFIVFIIMYIIQYYLLAVCLALQLICTTQ